jgi:ABC-type antimicrobial peptide transport system permease subunit
MALGAQRRSVLRMILLEGLRLAGAWSSACSALAASRALQSQLYGVSSSDPLTYACVAALIAGIAVLASLLPALRAASIAPAIALKAE